MTRYLLAFTLLLIVGLFGASAYAVNDSAQTFTLDGQLFHVGTNTPLVDSAARVTVQILDPSETCVVYEETQNVDTSATDGHFSIQVGSVPGSTKRSGLDLNQTMETIIQNIAAMPASSAPNKNCVGNSYSPGPGHFRYFRISVLPSGGSLDTLTPDMVLDSVPSAIVAQSVQGLERSSILQTNISTPPGEVLTQANLESLFTASAFANLAPVLAGKYVTSGTGGATLPAFATTPGTTAAGDIWYDSAGKNLVYSDGTSTHILGTAGAGVSSLTTGANLTANGVAGGTLNAAGTIDLATLGTAGTYTKVTVDTYGRVSGHGSIAETDLPTIVTAAKVSGAAITSGAISGTTSISTSGNLQTTGDVTANRIFIYDHQATPNYVGFQIPVAGTTSYTMTLPPAVGANNTVLTTTNTGILSWAAPVDTTKVSKAGDTMTGLLILSADPANVLGATTKQYVDSAVSSGAYVPIAGGTMTGALVNNTNSASTALAITQSGSGYAATFMGSNVGIGTTAPSEKLDINGNINISGILKLAATTSSAGQITLNGSPFLHGYGLFNSFVGSNAGNFTMTGAQNTASGQKALNSNTIGWDNTATGLRSLVGNTTGSDNSATGVNALANNTSGNSNTGMGDRSLGLSTTGNNNTALGYFAGNNITTGSNNIIIGSNVAAVSATASNQLNIANTIYGDISAGNVGIGTATPNSRLHVTGPTSVSSFTGTTSLGLTLDGHTADGSYSGIDFRSNVAGETGNPIARIAASTSSGGSFLRFGTTIDWASGITNTAMTIGAQGYVGIGTTGPGQVLDVGATTGTAAAINTVGTSRISRPNLASVKYPNVAEWAIGSYSTANASNTRLDLNLNNSQVISTTDMTAMTWLANGNVGIGNTAPAKLLHVGSASVGTGLAVANFQNVDGTCTITPASSGSGIACSSDERLKENFQDVTGAFALDRILQLQAVTYNFKTSSTDNRRTGYKAQEVQKVAPEFVRQNEDGLLQVYYDAFIPWITEAIKTLYSRITGVENHQVAQDREIASVKAEANAKTAKLEADSAAKDKKINHLEQENAAIKARLEKIEKALNSK